MEVTSSKTATVSGKPNSFCFENIIEKHKLSQSEILFIGDNLRTDIMFSNNAKIDSLLVLTGVSTQGRLDAGKLEGDGTPTYIAEDLRLE